MKTDREREGSVRFGRMVVFEFCCFPNLLPNSSWLLEERTNFVVVTIVVAVDVTVNVAACPQNQNLPKIQLVKDKTCTERKNG